MIQLPLKLFLEILWGYKKTDLRDKAVPGEDIIFWMRKVASIEQYVYFQQQEGCETITWQLDEWRRSGAKQEELKQVMEKKSTTADAIYERLRVLPGFEAMGIELLRALSHQLVHNQSKEGLRALGLKPEDVGL